MNDYISNKWISKTAREGLEREVTPGKERPVAHEYQWQIGERTPNHEVKENNGLTAQNMWEEDHRNDLTAYNMHEITREKKRTTGKDMTMDTIRYKE